MKPLLIAIIAIIAVVGMYHDTGTLTSNQFDDAYVSMRYAVNLAEHGELAFNLEERTDAASSMLYTVVLAGFYKVGLHNLEIVSFLLNMMAVGLIAAFVYLCALKLSGNEWVSAVLGLIAACHGFISGWAILSMDTVPFAALLVILTWAILSKRETMSMIMVILIVFMRVEGVLVIPFWWLATGMNIKKLVIVLIVAMTFYLYRFGYYGTLLPHSYHIKNVLTYYHSQPGNIIRTWKAFALTAPVIAIIGVYLDRRLWWLGGYIVVAGAVCLIGPSSDFVRYTVPLFPLMIIAGATLINNRKTAFIVCAILLVQGYDSVQWMHRNASALAPIQAIRTEAGTWLNENADSSRPVISGDIGAIAYKAIDFKFIDTIGLTSKDVLEAYQDGENLDRIINERKPAYIADTYTIEGGKLVYAHGSGSFVNDGKPSNMPPGNVVWGKQVGNNIAIAIEKFQ
jgi:hypothetical protein